MDNDNKGLIKNDALTSEEPQLPPDYTVQQQPGYSGQQQPVYPAQQQPGYSGQQQPVYPAQQQPGYSSMQQMQIQIGGQTPPIMKPQNYLGVAIFALVCCNTILGIPAVLFAAQVDSAYYQGDYEGAAQKSKNARNLSIAAIVGGMAIIVTVLTISLVLYVIPSSGA